jgi:hypothetical protein
VEGDSDDGVEITVLAQLAKDTVHILVEMAEHLEFRRILVISGSEHVVGILRVPA